MVALVKQLRHPQRHCTNERFCNETETTEFRLFPRCEKVLRNRNEWRYVSAMLTPSQPFPPSLHFFALPTIDLSDPGDTPCLRAASVTEDVLEGALERRAHIDLEVVCGRFGQAVDVVAHVSEGLFRELRFPCDERVVRAECGEHNMRSKKGRGMAPRPSPE
jgi:hypothetical protein